MNRQFGFIHDTGCLGLVHWNDPEGWYGEGGGRRVQDGEHVYTRADSRWYMAKPIQYCKVKKKTHTQYYIGSRYLELKFLKIPFTIAPKNEIPNYKSNKICTYLCPEDYGTAWEKIK